MAVATLIHSSEEAEGLIRWSMLFALSDGDERLIILHPESIEEPELIAIIDRWAEDHQVVPEREFVALKDVRDEEGILDQLRRPFINLAIFGQNREAGVDPGARELNRRIFDRAVCDSILLRLGNQMLEECESVLIPSAGGPHSRVALRKASRLASRFSGSITPLYITADIGEDDGQAVGHRILDKVISSAGISKKCDIHPEVVVANEVGKGISEAVSNKDYHLILIGASNSVSVKRKLFGAISPAMFDGDNAATIAVIRRRHSVGHRIRDFIERFFALRVPQLKRDDRISLFERLQTQSRWSFDFMALMLLATGIAALGLLQNSPAVVIGAMLVAPLMTPLLGSGLALVQGNLPMMRECLKSIVLGFLAALVIGILAGFISPSAGLTAELLARGNPNLLDCGVAALSGLAASYCVARPGLSSALAGVAIAAALVPPIATVGISLSLGEWVNAKGAALLFGMNVVAIILSAAAAFFASGLRGQIKAGKLWARRSIVLLLILLVILMVPLGTVLLSTAGKKISNEPGIRGAAITAIEAESKAKSLGIERYEVSLGKDQEGNLQVSYVAEILSSLPDDFIEHLAKRVRELIPGRNATVKVTTVLVSRASSD
ncbi:DUF389 domain-containing protein [Verrucomicrobiales bacterium]|nr:DUF389 domain-containing protein [Verrucomicrobiales bacterium]